MAKNLRFYPKFALCFQYEVWKSSIWQTITYSGDMQLATNNLIYIPEIWNAFPQLRPTAPLRDGSSTYPYHRVTGHK